MDLGSPGGCFGVGFQFNDCSAEIQNVVEIGRPLHSSVGLIKILQDVEATA